VADAWENDALMKRLQTNPTEVLQERGIKVQSGVTVKVLADTEKVAHLIIPLKPAEGELSEADLSTVSAGHSHYSHHSHRCGHCGGWHALRYSERRVLRRATPFGVPQGVPPEISAAPAIPKPDGWQTGLSAP
jgi:hypothetical protein